MATFNTLTATTDSNTDDYFLVHQDGGDYKQTRSFLEEGVADSDAVTTRLVNAGTGYYLVGEDSSTDANTILLSLPNASTQPDIFDGMTVRVKPAYANTGAVTVTYNTVSYALTDVNGEALTQDAYSTYFPVVIRYDGDLSGFVLSDTMSYIQATRVKIGRNAGLSGQGSSSVAIGNTSGNSSQGNAAIAIGDQTGATSQGTYAIAVGYQTGNSSQGANCIAIGSYAGETSQVAYAIAIGSQAGDLNQGNSAIAIGVQSAYTSQGQYSVAVGRQSGYTTQGTNSVAVGNQAGYTSQAASSVAIGYEAGYDTQSTLSVAIGYGAGLTTQGTQSVSIGNAAGYTNQGDYAVAVGSVAADTTQGDYAVSIGYEAGYSQQGAGSVTLGALAGHTTQGLAAIAIGYYAGYATQGDYSIALGYRSGFSTSVPDNSIHINATGANSAPSSEGDILIETDDHSIEVTDDGLYIDDGEVCTIADLNAAVVWIVPSTYSGNYDKSTVDGINGTTTAITEPDTLITNSDLDSVSEDTRLEIDNPFGEGVDCTCEAYVYATDSQSDHGAGWFSTGYYNDYSSGSYHRGTRASLGNGLIVLQTGAQGVTQSAGESTGGSFDGSTYLTSAPVMIKCYRKLF